MAYSLFLLNLDMVPPVRQYEPFINGRLISVREVPLANDISVWEVRELYFINSGIINSYFSYKYHAPPLILCLEPSLFLYLVPSSPLPL